MWGKNFIHEISLFFIISIHVWRVWPNINSSLRLARKFVRLFIRGYYLFRELTGFSRAKLEGNYKLWGTDYVPGQTSEHICQFHGGYCVYYPSNIFHNSRDLENAEYGIFKEWKVRTMYFPCFFKISPFENFSKVIKICFLFIISIHVHQNVVENIRNNHPV